MAIKKAIQTTMLGCLALFGVLFLQNGTQPSQFFSAQANVALRIAVNQTVGEPFSDAPVLKQEPTKLYVGGTAFGVKVFSDGVMVVGVSEVETANGMKSPAADAGVRTKDIITHINDQKVDRNEQVAAMLENSQGAPLQLTIYRKGEILTMTILPQQGLDGKFKGGLWVRDSTAGIGTFTFFDPTTGSFGGLGHGICDVDTGELIPVLEGTVVGAKIVDVKPGQKGSPGELIGVFEENQRIGMVYANTPAGVFGRFHKEYTPTGPLVEIGSKEQIKVGDATIISSASGSPKEYQIRITKILSNTTSAGKNMSIEATDPALLALTGGIVQGMSGSPILQNGKLIGAVTHVLVNDPTKGYGIFIENMLEQVQ